MASHQSSHHHSSSRQREREKDQRERYHGGASASAVSAIGGSSIPSGLFSGPIRKKDEDETAFKIKSTLGSFDQVRDILLSEGDKRLIGISNREITRIKGKKARIEQILTEMKGFPRAITGLDEPDDELDVQFNGSSQHSHGDSVSQLDVSDDEDSHLERKWLGGGDCRRAEVHPPERLRKLNDINGRLQRHDRTDHKRLDHATSSSSSSSESDSESSSASSSDAEDNDRSELGSCRSSVNLSTPVDETVLSSSERNDPPSTSQEKVETPEPVSSWDLSYFMASGSTKKPSEPDNITSKRLSQVKRVKTECSNEASTPTDNSVNRIIEQVVRGVPSLTPSLSSPSLSSRSPSRSPTPHPPVSSPSSASPPPSSRNVLHDDVSPSPARCLGDSSSSPSSSHIVKRKRKLSNKESPRVKHIKNSDSRSSNNHHICDTPPTQNYRENNEIIRSSPARKNIEERTSPKNIKPNLGSIPPSTSTSTTLSVPTAAAKKLLPDDERRKVIEEYSPTKSVKPLSSRKSEDIRSAEKKNLSILKENIERSIPPLPSPPSHIVCSISLDRLRRLPRKAAGETTAPGNKGGDLQHARNVNKSAVASKKSSQSSQDSKDKTLERNGKNSCNSLFPTPSVSSSSTKNTAKSDPKLLSLSKKEKSFSRSSSKSREVHEKARLKSSTMIEDLESTSTCNQQKSPLQGLTATPGKSISSTNERVTSTTVASTSNGSAEESARLNHDDIQSQDKKGSSVIPHPVPSRLDDKASPPDMTSSDFFLKEARALKHVADQESDRTLKHCKYLEAVLYFILAANAMEVRILGNLDKKLDDRALFALYRDTFTLFKHIMNNFIKTRPANQEVPLIDHKLCALSFRIQSILQLRISRMKQRELAENHKYIKTHAPEVPPPSNNSQTNTITIPVTLYEKMRKQLSLFQELGAAHDTWAQADLLVDRHPPVKAFFQALDTHTECRPISMNCTVDELVRYVRAGLQLLQ